MRTLPSWMTHRARGPEAVKLGERRSALPIETSYERRPYEVLSPGRRAEVYNRGADAGFLVGLFWGVILGLAVAFLGGVLVWAYFAEPSPVRSSGSSETRAMSSPVETEASPRPSTEVAAPPVPSLLPATPLRRDRDRSAGEECVPAGERLAHPERFVPDPQYRGRGHVVCGGERGTMAVRNRDGSIDVSRCRWCEW